MGKMSGMAGMGATPAMSGMAGMGATPGMSGMYGQTSAEPAGPPEITWVYKFPKNRTLEVLLNPEGIVVQVAVFGTAWPGIGTARGIRLGSLYKDVVVKYGFPESHEQQGIQLMAKYPDKQHVVFTMVGRTVVGITIALT